MMCLFPCMIARVLGAGVDSRSEVLRPWAEVNRESGLWEGDPGLALSFSSNFSLGGPKLSPEILVHASILDTGEDKGCMCCTAIHVPLNNGVK